MARVNANEFRHLQETWDTLGAEDPLWAVLSAPGTRGNRWDPDAFFATGEAEIAGLFDDLEARGVAWRRGRALDFGCGVGRLTQALADRFDRVDGVDIASSMVAAARRFNRHGDRCAYHVNEKTDLSLFSDGVFDLIYSRITLQHIPPDFTKAYIVEFARVLRSGGVAVVHIPAGMSRLREVVFRAAMTKRRLTRSVAALRRPTPALPQDGSPSHPVPRERKHEMYFLPERTVTDLLEQHGLVLAATEHGVNDGVHDVLYIVSKPLDRTSA